MPPTLTDCAAAGNRQGAPRPARRNEPAAPIPGQTDPTLEQCEGASQPTSHLPLAVRVDGLYAGFHDRPPLLDQASTSLGTTVDRGHTQMWGGDLDAELDTLLSPGVRLYLLAGGGWYDRRDSYYQREIVDGVLCGFYFCRQGAFLAAVRVGQTSTGMMFAENAGAGLEFSLGQGASFFVEARYMRFNQHGQRLDFVPIRVGLRF